MRKLWTLALAPITAWACTLQVETSAPTPSADAGADDAATDAPVPFPAFAPEMPVVQFHKGTVLKAPKVVTVTWSGDPNAAALAQFDDAIGATEFWRATTSEYGVGVASGGGHVSIVDPPPATLSDAELDTWISDHVAAAPGNGWPVADAETIYMIYLPTSTKLTLAGQDACSTTAGYHDETSTSQADHVMYAVALQRCHDALSSLAFSTETASHELVETATDPHTQSDVGWAGLDASHWAWDAWLQQQDELSDACQNFDDSYFASSELAGARVQRSWSNASAAKGSSPCVPAATGAYFNTTPLDLEPVSFKSQGRTVKTKGYVIGVGQTRTVRFGFYADAPTEAWNFVVTEGDGITPVAKPQLTIATTTQTGNNGDVASVDVTVNSGAGPILLTASSVTNKGLTRYMPVVVTTQ